MGKMSRKQAREFLNRDKCERCGGELGARIMSFFTTEIICMGCSEKETEIKKKLDNPSEYEGCGYVPEPED